MLRPPGQGAAPRFRPVDTRRRVKAVTIALVAFAAVGAGAWTFGVANGSPLMTHCDREEYVPPAPGPSMVNVYNSTQQVGLAEKVAQQLRDRGFRVDKVGNDDLRRRIRGTGELRVAPAAEDPQSAADWQAAAERQLVALRSWQGGMSIDRDERKKDATIDFVIGSKFDKLADIPVPPPGATLPNCKPSD